ncbi:putative ADP-ribosylation factor GTPase-activating protein AGD14-like [Capsicum annuum]|nr:putative ADP-ribosylation factor GTPase-activating protein AGD14-like [Capsicum annuum]
MVVEPELAPLLEFTSDGEGHVEGKSGVSFNKDTENDIGSVDRATKNIEDVVPPFDQPTAHTSSLLTVQPIAHTSPSFVQPTAHISSFPTDQPIAHVSSPHTDQPTAHVSSPIVVAPSSSTTAPTHLHATSDVESIDGGTERKGPDIGYDESVGGDRNSLEGKLAGDEVFYPSDEVASFETDLDDVTDEEDEVEQVEHRDKARRRKKVVEIENKTIWSWFIRIVKEDLQLGDGTDLTVITDMQKGLEIVVTEYLPNSEHRMCARHVLANWSKDAICRGARHKTIITILEEIRVKMMKRVGQMRNFCETWISDISQMPMKVLNDNTARSTKCSIEWYSDTGYEVLDRGYRHIVDLSRQYCSCRA